jgi:hypothetical protein
MEFDKRDTLQVHFRQSVPVTFLDHLMRRQEWVYEEARQQCLGNALWTEAEADWMMGDTMRALFEAEFRRAAIACGLSWENVSHNGKNCTYVRVSAGNFRISSHHVSSPGSFVPPAESRKQDAAVNQFMDEYIDEGLLCAPLPKLERAKEIVIYLLHGATKSHDGRRALFLEFAAPDADSEVYQWHCSLSGLRQAYLAEARDASPDASIEDKAKPKPKKRLSEEAESE